MNETKLSQADREAIIEGVLAGLRDLVAPLSTPLTVAEAAKRLNVSAGTIYDLVESKKITAEHIGNGRGTIRIRPEDLETYRQDARGTTALTSTSAKRQRHLGL